MNKNYKGPLPPKKSKKADLRRYSSVLFFIGLNLMLAASFYAFEFKTFFYPDAINGSNTTVVADAPEAGEDTEEEKILTINPEDIENIVNTEAFSHAIWPGYKGDVTDGYSVRKHFAENLAETIIDQGGTDVFKVTKVHFYYIVRDDGNIQFLSLVSGGRTSPDAPLHIVKHAQKLVNIGVPGIVPGTDVNGDFITVVYELVITFTPPR